MKFINLTLRNIKVYFSDKTMFATSLITPLILLVLYTTFLGNIFENSFLSSIPKGITVSNNIIKGLVSGQLISSLLAVSCVTVSFTSNLLMVQDKVNGSIKDINISPISKFVTSLSYFAASFISTIIVNLVALILCLIYVKTQGWFYNFKDILLLILDVILITLFGCSISSAINYKLSSQGQISAVGSIVSAGYGFICGAYMPISSFSTTIQKIVSYLPSTYITSLIKNHALNPVFNELASTKIPIKIIDEMKKGIDCRVYFYDNEVTISMMFLISIITILVFLEIFIIENLLNKKKR